jgi:hypothetical protein
LLLAGPMVAISSLSVPLALAIFHGHKLVQALSRARVHWLPIDTDQLPSDAYNYFASLDPTLTNQGYELVADHQYSHHRNFFRRLWVNASHTIYVSATRVKTERGTSYALTANSISENGMFFETTNLASDSFTVPAEDGHSFVKLPEATAEEIIEAHEQRLVDRMHEHDALPLQVAEGDEPQLCDYGRCCLAKAKRDEGIVHRLFWLATPYCEADVPIPPGAPWVPSRGPVAVG